MSYEEAQVGGRSDPGDDLYPGRCQLDGLSAQQLAADGVWWFPGPDGHLSGPDEQTVMPLDTGAALDDGSVDFPDGRYLLRAEFTLADGSVVPGHLTYHAPADGGTLRDREPTLCTPDGQVALWLGVLHPDEADVHAWLARIGRPRDAVFPLTWRAAFHPPGDALEGRLDGFAVWASGAIQTV